MQRSIYQIVR